LHRRRLRHSPSAPRSTDDRSGHKADARCGHFDSGRAAKVHGRIPGQRAAEASSASEVMRAAAFLGLLAASLALAQSRKSVWDGVSPAEQAARGKATFATTGAACHGADLTAANRPPLRGEAFLNHWMEGSLDALFGHVKSMPPNRANLG